MVARRPTPGPVPAVTDRLVHRGLGTARLSLVLVTLGLLTAACGGLAASGRHRPRSGPTVPIARPTAPTSPTPATPPPTQPSEVPAASSPPAGSQGVSPSMTPLPPPAPIAAASPGTGAWRPAGRLVDGSPALYETTLVPPGGSQPAGVAWMDTHLLAARLYSGSVSPGGGPYRYTAPIEPAQAASLVAAFNGGFKMDAAGGGYVTEGRTIVPLVAGAASLVITSGGGVTVGAWGTDVQMAPDVVSVRQNLVLLVDGGRPTTQAATPDWQAWGATCGATSCAPSVPGIEAQWRSGVGVTADGALVYAAGPALDPLQLAQLLVAAGVVRGMELDINPDWPVFASYDPPPGGLAAPANGTKLLPSTVQGPWTFFESWWARDFVTMSARPTTPG